MDSNLITLLVGVIGALLGAFGALLVQKSAQAEARQAAGRAVLAEMFTNADRALSAKSSLVLHEFTAFAWQQQLSLVAQSLNWEQLKILVNTYDSAARAFENAKEVIQENASEVIRQGKNESAAAQGDEAQFRRISSWFEEVAEEWIAAMRTLQSVVLNKRERRQLDEDIKKLEARMGPSIDTRVSTG